MTVNSTGMWTEISLISSCQPCFRSHEAVPSVSAQAVSYVHCVSQDPACSLRRIRETPYEIRNVHRVLRRL